MYITRFIPPQAVSAKVTPGSLSGLLLTWALNRWPAALYHNRRLLFSTLFNFLYVIFAFLGLFVSPLFYTFHLVDVVFWWEVIRVGVLPDAFVNRQLLYYDIHAFL